jgi:transcriptional regulator with XRE-family HTH domain
MAAIDVRGLGDFIREQRRGNDISLRQLAKLAGVSNPYLSQIERGMRRPSAEILQQIAKALRISAEALYVQAGILDERVAGGVVADAVLGDEGLTERQKQVLLEIYDSFRKENSIGAPGADEAAVVSVVTASEPAAADLANALGGGQPAAPARSRRAPAGAQPARTTRRRKSAGEPPDVAPRRTGRPSTSSTTGTTRNDTHDASGGTA